MYLILTRALANSLSQFTDLLSQPGDRGRHPAIPIAVSVGALDDVLEFAEIHDPNRRARGVNWRERLAPVDR